MHILVRPTLLISILALGGISLTAQPHRPFTATIRDSVLDGDKERISITSVVATRSDGSTARVRIRPIPGASGVTEQRTVLDLEARKETMLDGLTESSATRTLSRIEVAKRREGESCTAPEGGTPAGRILGVQVVRSVRVRVEADFRERTESWLAPALGCFPMRVVISHRDRASQAYQVANVREVVLLTMGEPEPSLFEMPEGYVARSNDEIRAEYLRRYRK